MAKDRQLMAEDSRDKPKITVDFNSAICHSLC